MRFVALLAIFAYQRFVSPYKGFGCAYRVHTGCRSCSVLGYRAIRRHGLADGLAILRRRFARCAAAHRRYGAFVGMGKAQRGVCDVGCDLPACDLPSCGLPCEFPSAGMPHSASDLISCCDCASCDCGDWGRSRKKSSEEKYVYIPPQKWQRRQRTAAPMNTSDPDQ